MRVRILSKPLYLDSQGGKFPYAEVAGAIESLGCKHVETTVSEGLSVSIDTYTVYDILYIINSILYTVYHKLYIIYCIYNNFG